MGLLVGCAMVQLCNCRGLLSKSRRLKSFRASADACHHHRPHVDPSILALQLQAQLDQMQCCLHWALCCGRAPPASPEAVPCRTFSFFCTLPQHLCCHFLFLPGPLPVPRLLRQWLPQLLQLPVPRTCAAAAAVPLLQLLLPTCHAVFFFGPSQSGNPACCTWGFCLDPAYVAGAQRHVAKVLLGVSSALAEDL